MLKIRKYLAIAVGKASIWISRLLGKQGTTMPGRIAAAIYPALLTELSQNVLRDCIVVTGTNGKTTTTNIAADIIKEHGLHLVHNEAGANMIAGITTAFVRATDLAGQKRYDYALLETDEANVPALLSLVSPSYVLVTNIFRDQLDRYGELDMVVGLLTSAFRDRDIQLILNADDPLQSHWPTLTGLVCRYYSFQGTAYDQPVSADSREGRYCMLCGHELQYGYFHYAQLGEFHCPRCGHCNQKPEFIGSELQLDGSTTFRIGELRIECPLQGFYNAYNVLAAVSLALAAGFDQDNIRRAVANFQPTAGRMETFIIDGQPAVLILVKNPTGMDQSLTIVAKDPRRKNILMALNDNAADGRDISWIWDAQVEILNHPVGDIAGVVCTGQRSGDMALRLKYAGLDINKLSIQPAMREAIEQAVTLEGQVSYILCTYTALFECRKLLLVMQDRLH